ELPYLNGSFDFVHQRMIGHRIPLAVWPGRVRDIYRVLRHGGLIEVVEQEIMLGNAGPRTTELNQHMLDQLLSLAGFRDVHRQSVEVPLGSWGGPSGELAQRAYVRMTNAMRSALLTVLPDDAALDELLACMGEEVSEYGTFVPVHFYWARKP
ncbi:hypothetical protein THASP1DRAFT_15942, partial [Thamnocephalis sphaerospora]